MKFRIDVVCEDDSDAISLPNHLINPSFLPKKIFPLLSKGQYEHSSYT